MLSRDACKEAAPVTRCRGLPFDIKTDRGAPVLIAPTDDPCFLLDHLGDELRKRGTAARDLLAISFKTHDGQITVSTRMQPLPERYPHLSEILYDIGRTCRDEGIAVEHLRRISFFEDEVNLETDDTRGGTDVFTWPIVPRSLDS